MSAETHRKRYIVFAVAVALIVVAVVALYLGTNSFVIRSVGIVAGLVSVRLIRISNIHSRSSSADIDKYGKRFGESKWQRRPIWMLSGIVLLACFCFAIFALYKDAIGGYKEIWPVYLFTGTVVVCMVFWSYLFWRNKL
jgi:hypothetical protein